MKIIRKEVKTRSLGMWGERFPGQDKMGYGSKIATHYMAIIDGRKYRIYCTQISNCASNWITVKGEKIFVDNELYSFRTKGN